jgi:Holliday junction resolvase RusA-like endonuclease
MIVISPLAVYLPRKTKEDKRVSINLNYYRNWKSYFSNDVKTQYKEAIKDQIEGLKLKTPIALSFKFFKPQNSRTDRANVCSITEKFFCDVLVECGCIPDDSDDFIEYSLYTSGGIDRDNPRVEISIMEEVGKMV